MPKKLVRTIPVKIIGEDSRGKTCGFLNRHDDEHLLCFRKATSVSGKHYHKGLSSRKDPEVLILIQGTMEIYCKHLKSGDEQRDIVDGPVRIEINPYVWHEFKALSDVTFLELNSLKDHQQDTFY
jgi:dTDP-4-dehydrorhamnose 3,5-epimerase-like enzyme